MAACNHPHLLLQILAATGEKLTEARREIEVLSKLSHRSCLKLLDSSISPGRTDAGSCYTVLMLFPAFEVCKRALRDALSLNV